MSARNQCIDVTGWLGFRAYPNSTIKGQIKSHRVGFTNRGSAHVYLTGSSFFGEADSGPALDLMNTALYLNGNEINEFGTIIDSEDANSTWLNQNHITNLNGTLIEVMNTDRLVFDNNLIDNGEVDVTVNGYYSMQNNEINAFSGGQTRAINISASNSSHNRFESNIINSNSQGVRIDGNHTSTKFLCNRFDFSPFAFTWLGNVHPIQGYTDFNSPNVILSSGNLFHDVTNHIGGTSSNIEYFYTLDIPAENPVTINNNAAEPVFISIESANCLEPGPIWSPPVAWPDPSIPIPVPTNNSVIRIQGCPIGIDCSQACPQGINCTAKCPPGINCSKPCPSGINCTLPCPPGINCFMPCPPGIDCTKPCPPGIDCTMPCPPGKDCSIPCYKDCNPCSRLNCDPILPKDDEVLQRISVLYQNNRSLISELNHSLNGELSSQIEHISEATKNEVLTAILEKGTKVTKQDLLNLFSNSTLFYESEMVDILSSNSTNMNDFEINKIVFDSNSFSNENISILETSKSNYSEDEWVKTLQKDHLEKEKSDLIYYALERLEHLTSESATSQKETWLNRLEDFSASIEISDIYFQRREFDKMYEILNQTKSEELSIAEPNDLQNYIALMNNLSQAIIRGQELNQLSDLSILELAANSSNRYSSSKAKSILRKFYNYEFSHKDYDRAVGKKLEFRESISEKKLTSKNSNLNSKIQVYPNPSKNGINVFSNYEDLVILECYDLSGKKLRTFKLPPTSRLELDLQVQSGVYLLKLYNSKNEILSSMMHTVID